MGGQTRWNNQIAMPGCSLLLTVLGCCLNPQGSVSKARDVQQLVTANFCFCCCWSLLLLAACCCFSLGTVSKVSSGLPERQPAAAGLHLQQKMVFIKSAAPAF